MAENGGAQIALTKAASKPDPRAVAFGREGDFNLGMQRRIMGKLRRQPRDEREPGGRLPGGDVTPVEEFALGADLVPGAARERFGHDLRLARGCNRMRLQHPATHLGREDLKGTVGGASDQNELADWDGSVRCHGRSFFAAR
ncbi:MAG: hypothetical protein ACKO1H_04265 [Tabrizicola sp.]